MNNQLSRQLGDEGTSLVKGTQCHLLCSENNIGDNFYGEDDGDGNTTSGRGGGAAAASGNTGVGWVVGGGIDGSWR